MQLRPLRLVAAFLCVLLAAQFAAAADRFPETTWERVDPEVAGWSKSKLAKAEEWSQRIASTAVMIVHRGAVIAEWGDTSAKTPLASVRKSLLSALIGKAVERGEMNLSQPIGALGIDDNEPSLTAEEKSATVRDLLMSRSGIYHAALYETVAMAAQRPRRFSHKPGSFWYYNNWDFNTLGTIYERAVRSSIFDAFEREIARPIGMQDYLPSDGEYFSGAASVYPAYPFRMSARDLARFALLYLHKGRWLDREIVPARWVDESTRPYSPSGFGPGYGYLWWAGSINSGFAPSVELPEGTFFAQGAGGQYAFVIPRYDLIVVRRGVHVDGGPNYREIGRLLWLVFDAGHFSDIGPNAAIEASHTPPANGETLLRILPGKTLLYGETANLGPYRIKLNADGSAAILRGREQTEVDTGTWSIRGDQLCRAWKKSASQCSAAVNDGSKIQLFDRAGMMLIDGLIVDD
jgi:CubicO group peptidase (beta-lactamase class C family)